MKSDSGGLSLEYYCFLATKNKRFLIDSLMQFRPPSWQGLDAATVVDSYTQIKCALASEPVADELFERHLLAHRLVAGEDMPEALRAFLDARIQPQKHFDGVDQQALLNGRWTAVAVPTVAGGGLGKVRWFIVGRLGAQTAPTLWPAWATPLLDADSRKAAQNAALAVWNNRNAAGAMPLCLFPLVPANGQCQFCGPSLGLPLALGFREVLTGESLARGVLATGGITPAGQIQRVSGLMEKCIGASEMGRFSLMLYPSANEALRAMDGWEFVQVATLDQAFMFARWYRPGNGNRLATLALMLADAEAFINNMADIPGQWIDHLVARGSLAPIIDAIAASADLFSRYVRNLENLLDQWRLDQVAILSDLVADVAAGRIATDSPLAAFRFHTACLTLANHRGDVAAADQVIGHADRLLGVAMHGNLELCADYLNLRLVDRQNRYCFDPELSEATHQLLTALEARHQVQCRFGCPTDPVLARLYGTIAQNYAFCGPSHLDDTLRYAGLSVQAFGAGRIPEYRQDMLRQHAYLTYAHLDAGMREAARAHLFQFLAVRDWESLRRQRDAGRLNRWQHAVLARFLADADAPENAGEYLDWCDTHEKAIATKDHPRQLWAFNLGRMALALGRLDEAEYWFKESLCICTGKPQHPTIHVMALLPMAGLLQMGILPEICDHEQIERVTEAAQRLNPDHFKPPDSYRILFLVESVGKNPQHFFPFNYR